MNGTETKPVASADERMGRAAQKKADRRRRARAGKKKAVWFGLGMFGLVGWAVAVPTLAGIVLGIWLDEHWPQPRVSWTISLLFVGIILGCANAWHWVSRERRPGPDRDSPAGHRDPPP